MEGLIRDKTRDRINNVISNLQSEGKRAPEGAQLLQSTAFPASTPSSPIRSSVASTSFSSSSTSPPSAPSPSPFSWSPVLLEAPACQHGRILWFSSKAEALGLLIGGAIKRRMVIGSRWRRKGKGEESSRGGSLVIGEGKEKEGLELLGLEKGRRKRKFVVLEMERERRRGVGHDWRRGGYR